jgi:hypothetical protein
MPPKARQRQRRADSVPRQTVGTPISHPSIMSNQYSSAYLRNKPERTSSLLKQASHTKNSTQHSPSIEYLQEILLHCPESDSGVVQISAFHCFALIGFSECRNRLWQPSQRAIKTSCSKSVSGLVKLDQAGKPRTIDAREESGCAIFASTEFWQGQLPNKCSSRNLDACHPSQRDCVFAA